MSYVVPPNLEAEVFDQSLLKNQPLETIKTRIMWKCENGHLWEKYLRDRLKGAKCPVCLNKTLLQGYNDLETVAPHLANQWHPIKNTITAKDIVYGSSKKAWWICELGHEYESSISERYLKNTGCAYCAGKRILPGYNDLVTLQPELAKEYSSKNITPANLVSPGSHKRVWWVCDKGHEYESRPVKRSTLKRNCPICANQLIIPGINDLKTIHPEVAKEWHPTRNSLTPEEVAPASPKKFWWECDKGHEWETSISHRTGQKRNCPVCANQKVLAGVNDLGTTSPATAQKWSTKNSKLVTEVTAGSNKKVWWECEKGHEYESRIIDQSKYSCPKCPTNSSKPEKDITDYLQTLGLHVENNVRKIIDNYELDIYVPSKNIAIEYNGLYWHTEKFRDKTYHYNKWLACKEAGIQLIQIWEDDWKRNSEFVKKMLAHKLEVSVSERVYARKIQMKSLTYTSVKEFLEENHIQGITTGSIYLGAFNPINQKLVAVLIAKYEPGSEKKTLSIVRYATSVPVVGGFTKLLKHLIRENPDVDSIITFSDNTVSEGNLYENNGFKNVKTLRPDYMYVYNGVRNHKFGFRLKRFKNDPELEYREELTESELALLNNIPRIWDAGKVKWELDLKKT